MNEIGIKTKIFHFIERIDKKTVFIALTVTIAIAYYINPLDNVDLQEWNRTFCLATHAGISINARIGNFYKLFFLYIPLVFIFLLAVLAFTLKLRPTYEDSFYNFSILLTVSTLASYISRYTSDSSQINANPMLQCTLAFLAILEIIALVDRTERYKFDDVMLFFLAFIISIMSCSLLFHAEELIAYVVVIGVILIGGIILMLYSSVGKAAYPVFRNFLFFVMWLPVVIRTALEGIYFLTEKGRGIECYYTHISQICFMFIVLSLIIVWFIRKKNYHLILFGYLGAIISFSAISFFSYTYQYTFTCSSFAEIYEYGNVAVAMDSYIHGKLPIVDYFSAHALGDVWTRLAYCFIHEDINGILVDPYGGLSAMIGLIVLFFIMKELFNDNIAILFVFMFPGIIGGIKWISICCIPIAMLLYICRKPSLKSYVVFWLCALISGFITYDEGISCGIACILAYLLCCLLEKEGKKLKQFVKCGVLVGTATLFLYLVYAVLTGVPVIGRIKEWISVSVRSSSSWATANFGDPSSFAFLISYFVVPMTALLLLLFVLVKYIKSKKHLRLMVLTVAFSLTEILYITRTIVYHNLAICSGRTGVLLNFIHWTVAVYVLYVVSEREKGENIEFLAFTGAMIAVILAEGTVVTQCWPSADSSLLNIGLVSSEKWDLRDDTTDNKGQARIVYDEDTTAMVNQFKNLFDTLLTDNQTFLDFANVTSMYLLTGRERPSYVGQMPSLLTDIYSQECFLEEISKYDCPLAIMGTTETSYLQQMTGIPHNVRYYKIAEYLYDNYQPLVTFGEFAIWCVKESYDTYWTILDSHGFTDAGYTLVDYGYDFTTSYTDENGNTQSLFMPYHSYDLGQIPYIWANYDDYHAIDNNVIKKIPAIDTNLYSFEGSQAVIGAQGNYLAFEMTSPSEHSACIELYDSTNEGARFQYGFLVKPGTNQYLIRVSQDYFWDVYNIDTILFEDNETNVVDHVRILEGD